MADDSNRASSTNIDVIVNGTEVPDDEVLRFTIEMDLNQADMAVITLVNRGNRQSNQYKPGDSLEVKVTADKKTIFKGEVVGLEPLYAAGEDSKIVLRAFNRLHRLLRGRKSRTFQDQSDNDIVNTICGDHGLSGDCGSDVNITHKHCYQHNQTDLEFLRTRAARIGYAVWVEDKTLHFKKPDVQSDSGIVFKLSKEGGAGHRMKRFAPRLSSAGTVKSVTVRGWDPEKKQEIVGTATASSSKLGATDAASAANAFGDTKTFVVDHPIMSVEEAKAIAQSKLDDYMMTYITGEADCFGDPALKPGLVVKIVVNDEKADDVFNGKYFIVGCTHQFTPSGHSGGGAGGYTTMIKVARDAQKGS